MWFQVIKITVEPSVLSGSPFLLGLLKEKININYQDEVKSSRL